MRVYLIAIIAGAVIGPLAAIFLLGQYAPAHSSVNDARGDAFAAPVYRNKEPTVQDYHDILSASVTRLNAREMLLAVEVAGDPNQNMYCEAVYIWVINYPSISGNQRYAIVVPNFAPELGLGFTGWHVAVFHDNANRWVVPLRSMGPMSGNTVQINMDPAIIGNPSILWWQVFVMVGVDTATHNTPDFLMDGAPDTSSTMLFPFT